MTIEKFPEPFQHDIETAVSVLCSLGAQHVYIFGSLVEGIAEFSNSVLVDPVAKLSHPFVAILRESYVA